MNCRTMFALAFSYGDFRFLGCEVDGGAWKTGEVHSFLDFTRSMKISTNAKRNFMHTTKMSKTSRDILSVPKISRKTPLILREVAPWLVEGALSVVR